MLLQVKSIASLINLNHFSELTPSHLESLFTKHLFIKATAPRAADGEEEKSLSLYNNRDVFPKWLRSREDFQESFPQFNTTQADDAVVLRALKKQSSERNEYEVFILSEWLRKYCVFTSIGLQRSSSLVRFFKYKYYEAGQHICRQNDVGRSFYIMFSGKVVVKVNYDTVKLATLIRGQGFGELALISKGSKRTASVVTVEPTIVMILSGDDYELNLDQAKVNQIDEAIQFLHQNVKQFKFWSKSRVRLLASLSSKKTVPAGHLVVTQGQPVNALYFVLRGTCILQKEILHRRYNRWPTGLDQWETRRKKFVEKVDLKTMKRGKVFGEECLLDFGANHLYSVLAQTNVEILAVSKGDCEKVFKEGDLPLLLKRQASIKRALDMYLKKQSRYVQISSYQKKHELYTF